MRANQITRIISNFKLDEIKSVNEAPSRMLYKTASSIIYEKTVYLIFSLWPQAIFKGNDMNFNRFSFI